jgi:stearoyl-CoA desaturase (delta-9 desaturase)
LFFALHAFAALAIFFHTIPALVAFLSLYLISSFGVTVGYHRLLTHSGFITTPLIRNLLITAGSLSAQGGPLYWVSIHRQHHQFIDHDADPHNSRLGFWWSHIGWLLYSDNLFGYDPSYVSDLSSDPWLCWLDRNFLVLQTPLAFILFLVTFQISGLHNAIAMIIWAIPLRIVAVLHSTWLTNSVAHRWGYRNFETSDNSVNSWWVALLTLGEGWHNNHHAFPASARHGLKRWELDPSWWLISLLASLNLAWNVRSVKIRQ